MSSAAPMPDLGTSQEKQRLYGRYARGELGLREVTERVARVRAAAPPAGWLRRALGAFVAVVGALLMPHWGAKRD